MEIQKKDNELEKICKPIRKIGRAGLVLSGLCFTAAAYNLDLEKPFRESKNQKIREIYQALSTLNFSDEDYKPKDCWVAWTILGSTILLPSALASVFGKGQRY